MFYHRTAWNSVFVYWVNRTNPITHLSWTNVTLTNSIDWMNYLSENSFDQFHIYKKSLTDIIVTGWRIYEWWSIIDILPIDTSIWWANQILVTNATNYLYVSSWVIYITDVYDNTKYIFADVVVDNNWNVTSITKNKPLVFSSILASNVTTTLIDSRISAQKWQASWLATLDWAWHVPSIQLPSYVNNIVEVANYAALPVTWVTWKIYVALDTNLTYRWWGSAYVAVTDTTAVWWNVSWTLSSQTDLQWALDTLTNSITNTNSIKADKTNVLVLNNTKAYTPTAQYHPTTKSYVDNWLSKKTSIFWDWSDWDVIYSVNTNLTLNNVYNFNNLTINAWVTVWWVWWSTWNIYIKVAWTLTLNWIISSSNLIYNWDWSNLLWVQISLWSKWVWWNWWAWAWDNVAPGWTWWAWSSSWYGWWGWGWYARTSSWGNRPWWAGWAWWNPWWVGWAWNLTYDTNWNPWWLSAWGWGWWYWAAWWNAYWNVWWTATYTTDSWGWWWWGWWAPWVNAWLIIVYANNIVWSWLIDAWWTSWTNAWNWWWLVLNWWSAWGWWGWGWWWGGGWWACICVYNTSSFTWNIITAWWTWWSWWIGTQQWTALYAPWSWANWANWTSWTKIYKSYSNLI